MCHIKQLSSIFCFSISWTFLHISLTSFLNIWQNAPVKSPGLRFYGFVLIIIQYIPLIEIGQSWFLVYSWSLWKVVFDKGFVIFTHIVTVFAIVKVKVTQSYLILCDPMDYRVHGILQAWMLEWVAFPFSKGSSQPGDQTQVSCIAGRFSTS